MRFSRSSTILSWSMYDLANTIFSMNIVSLYFALWICKDLGGEDILYSIAYAISTLLIIISLPIMGSISDEYKKRIPYLIFFTIVSVIFCAAIGIRRSILWGLILFIFANYGYHLALVFYNALLPQVAGDEKKIGKVSGYGVSLGYLGAIIGLVLVWPFVDSVAFHRLPEFMQSLIKPLLLYQFTPQSEVQRGNAFLPTAIFFLVLSLPCFIIVKDEGGKKMRRFFRNFVTATRKIFETLRRAKRDYPNIFTFLIANFLYTDPINTIILFMAVYSVKAIGFSQSQVNIFMLVAATFAIIGSFVCGYICDAIGPKKTLKGILIGWIITLLLAAFSMSQWLFWFVGPLAGMFLGSVWVTARAMVVRLAPSDRLGEFFGLYGLTEKMSAVIGPLLWGLVILAFRGFGMIKYRLAVISLILFMAAGAWVLNKVQD